MQTAPNMDSTTLIQRLQADFADQIRLDLPEEFLAEGLQPDDDRGRLASTHPEVARELLFGRSRFALMDAAPMGHHSVGFWGCGSNGYAWYLIRRTLNERGHLRPHTGGVYTDVARAKADITDFVPPFVHPLRDVRRRGGRLYACESIGTGFYAAQVDGKGRKIEVAACGRADVVQLFDGLLGAAGGK